MGNASSDNSSGDKTSSNNTSGDKTPADKPHTIFDKVHEQYQHQDEQGNFIHDSQPPAKSP